MANPTTKKNQHGHPYNKEEPIWPSLQQRRTNMAIPTTKKNQHGQPYNKEEPTWPSLQQRRTNMAFVVGMAMLVLLCCRAGHVGSSLL
jgi:hypothetical protein